VSTRPNTLTALTAEQVNSYPVSTLNRSVTGDKLSDGPNKTAEDHEEDFLQLARERFKMCSNDTLKERQEMLIDLQFRCGKQWDPDVERARKGLQRPCHTINRIPEFTNHVVNNMRQARPAIKIDPVGDGADQEQAEIRQGIIQYIERISQADVAYDTSFEHMSIMGLGFMRIVDDWSVPGSPDMDLFIRWVSNPLTVYCDPNCTMPDWSDMKFAFIVDDMMPADFKAKYGEEAYDTRDAQFQSIGDTQKYWYPGGKVRVAEYFYVDYKNDTLLEFSDGSYVLLSELPQRATDAQKRAYVNYEADESGTPLPPQPDDITVVGQHKRLVPQVWWSKITATKVLKRRRWLGMHIPIIPVIGNQTILDGERIISGMVRYAREIQRLYNYIYSTLTEVIALTPKNQWVAEVGQIAPFRDIYERANREPLAALPYVGVQDKTGRPLPPPQRQSPIVEISGLIEALQLTDNMLKSVFSIYDASLGQRGPQESGIAINARKIESDTSTYNWGDNFLRALRYLGRQLNDLLPKYYNRPGRLIHILREDQSMTSVVIGNALINRKTKLPVLDDAGQPKILDLDDGTYSVVVSTGPSQQTLRQQNREAMLELVKVFPQLVQVAPVQIIQEFDFAHKDAIIDQLEKAMPPGLRTQGDGDQGPNPHQLYAQNQQLQALIQQLTQALHQATDKNAAEMQRAQMKEIMETFRTELTNETNRFIAMLKAGSNEAKFLGDKLFTEAERVSAAAEPKFIQNGQPSGAQTSSAESTVGGS